MKKKTKRWIAAAMVVAIAALTVPFGYAINYVGSTAAYGNTDEGLVDTAYTDVDNLFIYMMNQAMPVGTIYMTQAITTAGGMNTRYGGTWVAWGTGRSPVGVNTDGALPPVLGGTAGVLGSNGANQTNYPAQTYDDIGGTMNLSRNYGFAPTLTVGGAGITLTEGGITSIPGRIYWNNNTITVSRLSGTVSATSGTMATPSILHYHTITAPRYIINAYTTVRTGESGFNALLQSPNRTITTGDPVQTGGVASGFSTTASLDLSQYTPAPGLPPTITYTGPTAGYTRQNFSSPLATNGGLTLPGSAFSATYSSASITVSDETVQPYVVVYMYKRLTLADLNP